MANHTFRTFISAVAAAVVVSGAPAAVLAAAPSAAPDAKAAPIPDTDFAPIARELGLHESAKPVREMVKGWKKPTKIVVFAGNRPGRLEWLQKVAPGVRLVAVKDERSPEALKELADADAQLGGACDNKHILASNTIKWLQSVHAGNEICLTGNVTDRLKNGEMVVTSEKGVFAPLVAQNGIAMLLALDRGLDLYARMAEKGHINVKRDATGVPMGRLRDFNGQTVLVVGLGATGTWMAKYAHGLGMKVTGVRNTSKEHPDFVDYVGLTDELPSLLPKADVVAVSVPVTAKTTGMMNAKFFSQMKHGAILINMSHPATLNAQDLVAALDSGQLSAAATDNVPGFTPTESDPLFHVANLLITPHKGATADVGPSSGPSAGDSERTWLLARENLRRFVNGDKLYSVVDPKLEY